jgi:hypothetical protein
VATVLDDVPARVALAEARRDHAPAQHGHRDLAAVGVARDRERDAVGDRGEHVGIVTEEDDGRVRRDVAQRDAHVRAARARVGEAGDVERADVDRRVLEHRDAGAAQGGGDPLAAVVPVVVAQDGEHAQPRVQPAEALGDGLGRDRAAATDVRVDEVAEQQREVGRALVDGGDEALDALLVDMRRAGVQVGDERDTEPVELGGPAREPQLALADPAAARLVPERAPGDGGRSDGGRGGAGRGGSSGALHAGER